LLEEVSALDAVEDLDQPGQRIWPDIAIAAFGLLETTEHGTRAGAGAG
jgi:hypothetical protein